MSWRQRVRGGLILAFLVTVVVGGFFAGRAAVRALIDPDPTIAPAAVTAGSLALPPMAPSAPAPGPAFPRSREGAGGAGASHSMALAGVALADPTTRARTYATITTERARPELLALAASSQGILQRNLAGGPRPVVLRGAPLGYRILAYTPTRAVVDVWSVGIVGGAALAPVATWESTVVTLEWENGAWRLDSFRTQPGLTPAPGTGANPDQLLTDQAGYQGYARFTP